MLFGKLLPREGNFFEMFNQHGDLIVRRRALVHGSWSRNYDDATLREKYAAEVDNAERAADKVTAEVNRAAAQDLHHADRPRADPRPDQRAWTTCST